jgi:hypothetical protein
MNKLIVMYVVAAAVFCAGLALHVTAPKAAKETQVQKWTLVRDKTTYKGESLTDLDLMWVISPKGEWLVVPEAQKERFKSSKQGEHVQLPESVKLWDRVIMAPGQTDSAQLQTGLPVSRPNSLNPDIKSVLIPSYFYSRS